MFGIFKTSTLATPADPFRLRVYKSVKLLTPRVRSEQMTFNVVLGLMLLVDTWAWSRAWAYGLGGLVLPVLLGLCFGLSSVLFDRSVIVADTTVGNNGWTTIIGRACLLVLVSFLTAVPVELAVFESEISIKLDSQEKEAADKIRDKAVSIETARLDTEIADLNTQLSSDASATTANAEQDLSRFQSDRTRERSQLLEMQTTNRASLEKNLSEKSEQVALEAAGKGPSGKYGSGPAFQAMKAQEVEARQALDSFNAQAASAISAFDAETLSKLEQRRAARDTTVTDSQSVAFKLLEKKRNERREKVEEIRTMDYDKLSNLYGGSWKVSRGFLNRFHALSEMAATDWYVELIVWGCRIAMVLLGLFVLGLKLMASQEFRMYYSVAAQAKAGDDDAKEVVNNLGYQDHEHYGNSANVRDLLAELHTSRQKVWQALWSLEQKLADLAGLNPFGLHRTRLEIEGRLHAAWLEAGAEQLAEVNRIEEKLRLIGVTAPPWPTKLGSDPRGKEPWKVSDSALATFGWKSPDNQIEACRKARQDLVINRRELRKLLSALEIDLHKLIGGNPTVSKREIEALRRSAYESMVVPILDRIADAESVIEDSKGAVPQWPVDFSDPRPGLFERLCRLDERELNDRYGWQV